MLKIFVTYDQSKMLKAILQETLDGLELEYQLLNTNELVFNKPLDSDSRNHLKLLLNGYGIYLVEDQNLALVDRIKAAIKDMLFSEKAQILNASDYLAEKLNYSYSYLSTLFSETTHTSIENYIILSKVDKAKDLLINTDLNLTEVAYQLHYSSVAHLSRQFKKTTGLTPSLFQKIIEKRKSTT